MKVAIVQNAEEGSKLAAEIFIDQVKNNPKTVLGLATGSTPVKMYKLLAEAYKAGTVSFKDCQSFNLDEYLGLAPEHDQSYHQAESGSVPYTVQARGAHRSLPRRDARHRAALRQGHRPLLISLLPIFSRKDYAQ